MPDPVVNFKAGASYMPVNMPKVMFVTISTLSNFLCLDNHVVHLNLFFNFCGILSTLILSTVFVL